MRRFYHIKIEHGFAFSPDGKTVVSGGSHFRSWDIARGHEIHRFPKLGAVKSLAFRPDGKAIATANGDELQISEIATGRQVRRITTNGYLDTIESVAYSPDGKVLASSGYVGSLQLWDADTGREIRRIGGLRGWTRCVAFTPDGRFIAAGDERGAHLWDSVTGQEDPAKSPLPAGPVDLVCFARDGKTIALGGRDEVSVWSLRSNRAINKRLFNPWTLAIAPDGKTVAVGGYSGLVHVWNLEDDNEVEGGPRRAFKDDPPSIHALAFSSDGKTLASAGEDNFVTLRDPVTGQERKRLAGHEAEVNSLAFAPDGKTLASGSLDGTVLFWDLSVVDKEP